MSDNSLTRAIIIMNGRNRMNVIIIISVSRACAACSYVLVVNTDSCIDELISKRTVV